jgi:GxxExxY protein
LRQVEVPIEYKGITFEEKLKVDLIAEDCLIVELKCVQTVHPVHEAQLLSYMKLLNAPLGLLINFYTEHLKDGIRRFVLKGAGR